MSDLSPLCTRKADIDSVTAWWIVEHIPSCSITLVGTAVSWQAEQLRFIRRSHNGQAG